ncbi:MAG: HEPN domain-containing protein [Anaerovibrio sp.]
MEFGLKYVLELHGVQYPHTHHIATLLNYMPLNSRKLFKDIEKDAAVITKMETETRYPSSFRATIALAEKYVQVAERAIATVNELEKIIGVQRKKQEQREDMIWENDFPKNSPEYIFCQNYEKEYKRLGAPTSREGYDKATRFAVKALYFAHVAKEKILTVVDELAPMVPHQEADKPYSHEITEAVENMEDVKAFLKK